jgi:hypothetical protein
MYVGRVQGVTSANFAMEYELLLNKTGALYICTLHIYVCLQKEGTRVLGLSKRQQGIGLVLDEQNMV